MLNNVVDLLRSVLLDKFPISVPLSSSPLADVNISVGVFVHPFSIIWRGCCSRLPRIYGRVFFVQKFITAVTAHPPVTEPSLTTATTIATWPARTASAEMTLTYQAHACTHGRLSQRVTLLSAS